MEKRCNRSYFFFVILLLMALPVYGRGTEKEKNVPLGVRDGRRPNVIYILADDLGLGLLSHFGQQIIKTPHIDAIAEAGISYERAYAGVFCAPSRASLLTGYNEVRRDKYRLTGSGIYTQLLPGKYTDSEIQTAVNRTIGKEADIDYLPQVFKKAGYVTGQIGKLEYGFTTTEQQLKNHGWDYHYGYYDHTMCHGFYPPFMHENGRLIMIPGNTHADAAKEGEWGSSVQEEKARWDKNGKKVYSQDIFLDKILAFIENNRDKPFFLYHPTQLPHGPVSIPAIAPEFAFRTDLTEIEKAYASMVRKLDDQVGMIVAELKRLGIYENTILIFSSDNGHELYYSYKGRVEKPYRNMKTGKLYDNVSDKFYSQTGGDVFNGNMGLAGLKRSNFEGGTRVPLFISYPKMIKAGSTSDQMITNYDFLATMADLLKVKTSDDKDGISFLASWKGKKDENTERKDVLLVTPMGPALIQKNGWKLRMMYHEQVFQLFNLKKDPEEKQNLLVQPQSKEVEAIFAQMKGKMLNMCEGDFRNGLFVDGEMLKAIDL